MNAIRDGHTIRWRANGLVFTEQGRTAADESTSLCRRYCSQRPCWFAVRCIRSGRSRSPRLVRSDASVPVNNCQLCVDRWGHGGRPFPCEFHVPCWHLCSQVQAWTASALRGDGITAMARIGLPRERFGATRLLPLCPAREIRGSRIDPTLTSKEIYWPAVHPGSNPHNLYVRVREPTPTGASRISS